ncbi:hypothetical protein GCM10010207_56450 [Streptomyces atratus]|nr:hypothetical protein GCM10010207_56450 [Streptomyces atratus]
MAPAHGDIEAVVHHDPIAAPEFAPGHARLRPRDDGFRTEFRYPHQDLDDRTRLSSKSVPRPVRPLPSACEAVPAGVRRVARTDAATPHPAYTVARSLAVGRHRAAIEYGGQSAGTT